MRNKQMLNRLAEEAGLKVDKQTKILFGNKKGYLVYLMQGNQSNQFIFSVSVCQGSELPDMKDLKQFVKQTKLLADCTVQRYKVTFTVRGGITKQKSINNVCEVLEQTVQYLREKNYSNCCQSCGLETTAQVYNVAGAASILCPDCFSAVSNSADIQIQQQKRKAENVIGGIVGALLGSIIGAAVIVLLGQLGYVTALSGIVMGACTLKGYEILGGRLSVKGIIISVILIVGMVYIGNRVDLAITVTQYFEVDIVSAFHAIPDLISNEIIGVGAYYSNLVLVYIFTLLGAIPTVIGSIRDRKFASITCKMENE